MKRIKSSTIMVSENEYHPAIYIHRTGVGICKAYIAKTNLRLSRIKWIQDAILAKWINRGVK